MKNAKKKLKSFCFFAWIVFTCLLKIRPKNKKDLIFLLFALVQVRVPSRNQKTLEIFSRPRPQKNKKNRGKPKTKHEPQTKTSPKSCVFLFFLFSRGLEGRRICGALMPGPYLILVLQLIMCSLCEGGVVNIRI